MCLAPLSSAGSPDAKQAKEGTQLSDPPEEPQTTTGGVEETNVSSGPDSSCVQDARPDASEEGPVCKGTEVGEQSKPPDASTVRAAESTDGSDHAPADCGCHSQSSRPEFRSAESRYMKHQEMRFGPSQQNPAGWFENQQKSEQYGTTQRNYYRPSNGDTSLFGAERSSHDNPILFGGPSSGGASLFGADRPSHGTPNLFGGPSSGGASLFGAAHPSQGTPPSIASSLSGAERPFHGTPNLFGSSCTPDNVYGAHQAHSNLNYSQGPSNAGRFGSSSPSSHGWFGPQNGLFGSAQPTSQNLFGPMNGLFQPQSNTSGLFGSQCEPNVSGLFGSKDNSTQPNCRGWLGSSCASAPSNTMYGPNYGSAQPNSSGMFGSNYGSTPFNSNGWFGSNYGSTQPNSNGWFGSNYGSTPFNSNGWFGSNYGSAQPNSNGWFGSNYGSVQPNSNGLFGSSQFNGPKSNTCGWFGSNYGSAQPNSNGLFGSSQFNGPKSNTCGWFGCQFNHYGLVGSQQSPNGLFGAHQNGTGLFGSAQPNTNGLFGLTQSNTNGLFGSAQPNTHALFGSAQPNTNGMFGSAQPNTNGLFGSAQPNTNGLFGSPCNAHQSPNGTWLGHTDNRPFGAPQPEFNQQNTPTVNQSAAASSGGNFRFGSLLDEINALKREQDLRGATLQRLTNVEILIDRMYNQLRILSNQLHQGSLALRQDLAAANINPDGGGNVDLCCVCETSNKLISLESTTRSMQTQLSQLSHAAHKCSLDLQRLSKSKNDWCNLQCGTTTADNPPNRSTESRLKGVVKLS